MQINVGKKKRSDYQALADGIMGKGKKEKKRKFPAHSPIKRKTERERRKDSRDAAEGDYWNIPGMWTINVIAKDNPTVAKVRDSFFAMTRDELAARLCLIYCNMIGLAGLERE